MPSSQRAPGEPARPGRPASPPSWPSRTSKFCRSYTLQLVPQTRPSLDCTPSCMHLSFANRELVLHNFAANCHFPAFKFNLYLLWLLDASSTRFGTEIPSHVSIHMIAPRSRLYGTLAALTPEALSSCAALLSRTTLIDNSIIGSFASITHYRRIH